MKVLIYSASQFLTDRIAMLCASRLPPVSASVVAGPLRDVGVQLSPDIPTVVVLDEDRLKPGDLADAESVGAQFPRLTFMLAAQQQSPELLIPAMRAGVREVLTQPLDAERFNEALDRLMEKSAPAGDRNGRIAAFIPCKGGSGATFIAANLGVALAEKMKKKVLLIDFNQQSGDASMYVTERKPTLTLPELFRQIGRLDAGFLESSLVPVSPNFGILAAPEDVTQIADPEPEHVDLLLRLARRHYDIVLLDIGRKIDATAIRALDNTDLIYPVVQLSLPYLRDARRLLDVFRSLGYSRDKARLVVNRYERGGKLGLADLSRVVNIEVAQTVANNYQVVSDSVNQGVPVLQLARNSNVAKNLGELAQQIAGTRPEEGKGLFGRLFARPAPAGA